MLKSLKGDTIIYSFNGPKRIDTISIDDYVLTNKASYSKVIDIIKNNNLKKNYKVKINNNIDSFILTKYTELYSIQNIPYDINIKDIPEYIDYNLQSLPKYNPIYKLTDFDYIGYTIPPFIDNIILENKSISSNPDNLDYYRFYGLLMYFNFNKIFKIDIDKHIKVVEFIRNYLNIHYISYTENITKTILFIDFDNTNIDKKFNINYNNLNKECSIELLKGFLELAVENDNKPYIYYKTANKNNIYIIKFLLMKFEILISTIFYNNSNENNKGFDKNNNKTNYIIRIPKTKFICDLFNITFKPEFVENINYFIYNNHIWTKIKNISEIDSKTVVYMLKLENDMAHYITDIGNTNNIIIYN
jgi:hypothetical protein